MTRDDLRGIVEGISDEQLKKILDIHSADIGRAKNDYAAVQNELEAARTHSLALEEELSLMKDSQCEADEMKKKIEELQKVIDKNVQAEAEIAAEKQIGSRFEAATGDRAFVNELTKKGIFEEFKAAVLCGGSADKSDAEVFDGLVSDRENLFAPKGGIPSITGSAMGFSMDLGESDVREIMGLK